MIRKICRKRKDAELLKKLRSDANVPFLQFLQKLDKGLLYKNIRRDIVTGFILEKGKNAEITEYVKAMRRNPDDEESGEMV